MTTDSSTFPAVPYYLAKAGVMGALEVLRRPSRAILDSPRVLGAPRVPYRPSLEQPYARGSAPLMELPMAVAPFTRLPFIGTFATSLPWPLVEATYRSMRGDTFFNFELHAIDVLDDTDGIPPELVRQQRTSSVPYRVSHLRERNGLQVDLVIELPDGSVYGLEVRTAAGLRPHQFARLEALAYPAYLVGLADAGWDGDERAVRLGFALAGGMLYSLFACWWIGLALDESRHAAAEQRAGRSIDAFFEQKSYLLDYVLGLVDEGYALARALGGD